MRDIERRRLGGTASCLYGITCHFQLGQLRDPSVRSAGYEVPAVFN